MAVENKGETLLVCPYRQERRGRLAVVEPQEGCPKFRERVRPKDGSGDQTCAIPLVNMDGLCTLVDPADYEWLSRYTWRAVCTRGGEFYACTYCERKWRFMHRMIMNPPAGLVVDHKNRYGLDNQRINLRIATPGQNNFNRQFSVGVSGFRGVYPCRDKWLAQIGHQWGKVRIGVFDDPAEAARAYDRKAIELHGEFAFLNFPEETRGRIVCLGGKARVCPAAVARIRQMLCRSSPGPLASPACAEATPCLHGACPCLAEEEAALPVFLGAGERHLGLLSGLAAQSLSVGRLAFTRRGYHPKRAGGHGAAHRSRVNENRSEDDVAGCMTVHAVASARGCSDRFEGCVYRVTGTGGEEHKRIILRPHSPASLKR